MNDTEAVRLEYNVFYLIIMQNMCTQLGEKWSQKSEMSSLGMNSVDVMYALLQMIKIFIFGQCVVSDSQASTCMYIVHHLFKCLLAI